MNLGTELYSFGRIVPDNQCPDFNIKTEIWLVVKTGRHSGSGTVTDSKVTRSGVKSGHWSI